MGVLKVRCPESGREVSTGIEIDPQSFAALPDKLPVSNCPLCHRRLISSRQTSIFARD